MRINPLKILDDESELDRLRDERDSLDDELINSEEGLEREVFGAIPMSRVNADLENMDLYDPDYHRIMKNITGGNGHHIIDANGLLLGG